METATEHTLPLTRIQKLIGRLMRQSKRTKAAAYLSVRADLTELTAARRRYSRKSDIRVTTNDFFVRAMAKALVQHPLMAAIVDPDGRELVIPSEIGVGFAVAAPQGLVVPVIHDIGDKSLAKIAAESCELLEKARANKLMPDDFDGASIVLTGLGMYGINAFYAIAPPSANSILAIGIMEDTLIPAGKEITVRKIMEVCLSFDQRIASEFYAAEFMRCVVDYIERPQSMME